MWGSATLHTRLGPTNNLAPDPPPTLHTASPLTPPMQGCRHPCVPGHCTVERGYGAKWTHVEGEVRPSREDTGHMQEEAKLGNC